MQCKACEAILPSDAFYASNRSVCKSCVRARSAEQRTAPHRLEQDRQRGRTPERKAVQTQRRPRYRERKTEYDARWIANNPEKRTAHVAVGNAVRDGVISKRPCQHPGCGSWAVEAHHEDHSRTLEVVWLCVEHHGLRRRA